MTEDEMVRQYHRLNRHEFEQTLGDSKGQESLACCSPWGRRELNTSYRLNSNSVERMERQMLSTLCLLVDTWTESSVWFLCIQLLEHSYPGLLVEILSCEVGAHPVSLDSPCL